MSWHRWAELAHSRKASRARQRTLPGVSVRRSDALPPAAQAEAASAMLDLLAGRIDAREYARRLAAL